MGNRRTFEDWISELREVVRDQFELELEQLPEFDRADARSYYKERSAPSLYFKECLSEHCEDGQKLGEIMLRVDE
jgi:hypothetical protein